MSESPRSPLARDLPLGDIVASITEAEVRGDPGVRIADIVYRSQEATPGALFCCVPGSRVDGHDFALDAVARGAVALVVERWLDVPSPQVRVPWVRGAMGPAAAAVFGNPSRRFPVVGVTGTNGKTTTTYLVESIARAAGLTPAVVGTNGVRIDGRAVKYERTTPEAPDLQRLFARMHVEGVTAAAMEVSSHGLDQHRVDGTRYACAIFTNFTQDHLDYHGSMEAYFATKARLFTPALSDAGVVNVDSPPGRRFAAASGVPVVTFGLKPGADVVATGVRVTDGGISFRVERIEIRSRLRAMFNVANCLGAAVAARQLGIDDAAIAEGIWSLPGVPGRFEPVEAGQPFLVLVDYAHTPDSLENVLTAARALARERLIVVFGCGGDRDRTKRPLMGEVATRLADLSVITSDNPRSEEPEAIIAEIEAGARRGGGDCVVQPDRREAIRIAVAKAAAGDVVVIAGKGHETGQEFADRTIPFDDRNVAREELEPLSGGGGS